MACSTPKPKIVEISKGIQISCSACSYDNSPTKKYCDMCTALLQRGRNRTVPPKEDIQRGNEPVVLIKPGDAVRARWSGDGHIYDGKVVSVNTAGLYDIIFYDGVPEKNVRPENIFLKRKACFIPFKTEDLVEAQWGGGICWYPGKILAVNNGLFHVAYDDGTFEKAVKPEHIRLKSAEPDPLRLRSVISDSGSFNKANMVKDADSLNVCSNKRKAQEVSEGTPSKIFVLYQDENRQKQKKVKVPDICSSTSTQKQNFTKKASPRYVHKTDLPFGEDFLFHPGLYQPKPYAQGSKVRSALSNGVLKPISCHDLLKRSHTEKKAYKRLHTEERKDLSYQGLTGDFNGITTQTSAKDQMYQSDRNHATGNDVSWIFGSIQKETEPNSFEFPEWQWCDESGNWITYLVPDQLQIEEAFKSNKDTVMIIAGQNSQTYSINTKTLTQTNVNHGTKKTIRRLVILKNKEEFEWRWCREDGQWVAYPQLFQQQIEDAFKSKGQVTYSAENGQMYCVDTAMLIQTNVPIGTTKLVQRINTREVAPQSTPQKYSKEIFQYPSSWIQFDDDSSLILSQVETNSAEYAQVSQKFYHSCSSACYIVKKISRVQNIDRFKEYQLYRTELVKALGKNGINEKKLFHGTDYQAADSICKDGFDWRRCGKNGTVYGKGTYFALNSKYSASGYSTPNSSGECKMFLASVLLGNYAQGSPKLSVPPTGFHSLVDSVSSPTIFVVFERKQSYPEYLITYRKV